MYYQEEDKIRKRLDDDQRKRWYDYASEEELSNLRDLIDNAPEKIRTSSGLVSASSKREIKYLKDHVKEIDKKVMKEKEYFPEKGRIVLYERWQ